MRHLCKYHDFFKKLCIRPPSSVFYFVNLQGGKAAAQRMVLLYGTDDRDHISYRRGVLLKAIYFFTLNHNTEVGSKCRKVPVSIVYFVYLGLRILAFDLSPLHIHSLRTLK